MDDIIKRHPTLGKKGWRAQLKKYHSNCLNTEIYSARDKRKHS